MIIKQNISHKYDVYTVEHVHRIDEGITIWGHDVKNKTSYLLIDRSGEGYVYTYVWPTDIYTMEDYFNLLD